MSTARSYLQETAQLLETKPGEFGIIARTPLGVLRDSWNLMLDGQIDQFTDILSQWRETYGDKNLFESKITRVRLSLPPMHRNTRIRVLSALFGREIKSGNDMTYGEALALIQMAYPKYDPTRPDDCLTPRIEYTNLINRIAEEVQALAA